MNPRIRLLSITAMLVLAAGCATPSYKKGESAAVSLSQAATHVRAESQAIDITLSRLSELVGKPAPDLRPQFKGYESALNSLIALAKKIDVRGLDMERKHLAYFAAWETNLAAMNYDVVRNASETRKKEVMEAFDAVSRRYNEAQSAVQPLINYFRDIRTALEADLTPQGLASVKSIYANAEDNAKKVQSALGKLSQELAQFSERMSAVNAEAPAPTGS